jgi:signal transduction histidine kinase/phage shock protein PspC (stress-responsive transcriptional regulator)
VSTAPARPPLARRASRLRRDPGDRMVAGVCAAIARELGIDPVVIRVGFVGAAVAGGAGVVMYALGWLLIPPVDAGARPRPRAAREGGVAWRVAGGLGLMVLGLVLLVRELGFLFSDALVWPVVLGATGTALIWYRSAGSRRRETAVVTEVPGPGGAAPVRRQVPRLDVTPLRVAVGALLVVGAVTVALVTQGALGGWRDAVLWALGVVVALGLILTPLLARLAATLGEERAERIRTQERAELAAHLHDSVLQTLALVQRQAGDPRAVAALARRQERELRDWLWGQAPEGPARLAGALRAVAAEVEDAHGVAVEVVAVGDTGLDERTAAVVAAAREAMTNAAKFAGDGPVSVYAEAGPAGVEVYVRDRGAGFDPAAIPPGRHGVRDSIIGRMDRHGGTATVRSGPGGTEVELRMAGAA